MEKVMTAPKVASNVTIIPRKLKADILPTLDNIGKKKRVCGYARVSTNMEEQESSYEAQVDYYTNYIKAKPEWEFVGLFADEGLSGTSTKKRDGFNNMIKEALDGKIDLIITKSVSRFARNTVDSLTTIRKLKEKNVEVYFEKENIYTLDSKGELLITLMSSLSQEESRSISLNTTIGKRWSFANGKVSIAYSTFLGYDKGENGKMVVNKEQAKTIKFIYQLFLKGYSLYTIKKELEKSRLKTPFGKDKWHVSTLRSILKNEKYIGDAILQKQYTVDYLTKKQKKNEGELPQYYVSNDHEGIIDKQTFDFVQIELKKRLESNTTTHGNKYTSKYSGINIFSGKLICGECGAYYGRKIWHSNDKYRRIVYRCNNKYLDKKCETMAVTEQDVKDLFVKEYNKLDASKAIKNAKDVIKKITKTDTYEKMLKDANETATSLVNQINDLIDKNARVAMNQDDFNKEKERLSNFYNHEKENIDKYTKEIEGRKARRVLLESFITNIENAHKIKEFDEELFCALVDKILVFKDRMEIKWRGIS